MRSPSHRKSSTTESQSNAMLDSMNTSMVSNQKIVNKDKTFVIFQIAEDLFDYVARRCKESNPLTVAESASIMMEVAEIMIPLHA